MLDILMDHGSRSVKPAALAGISRHLSLVGLPKESAMLRSVLWVLLCGVGAVAVLGCKSPRHA